MGAKESVAVGRFWRNPTLKAIENHDASLNAKFNGAAASFLTP